MINCMFLYMIKHTNKLMFSNKNVQEIHFCYTFISLNKTYC